MTAKKFAAKWHDDAENVLQDFKECVQIRLMSSLMYGSLVELQDIDEDLRTNDLEKEVVSVSWVGLARKLQGT
jgi:hypothetical protein